MKGSIATTAKIIKRISLEDVYQEIEIKTSEIKKQQQEDFRYLSQIIDVLSQKVDFEIGQVRQEIGQFRQEISSRLDSITQLIVEVLKQKNQP